ncbi:hypothetical protein FB567DRAFT_542956 [Paraphoma chrysanthemicola]|uniref:Uncharacterized protein n=1 Tax=Paraphoma chrysanthemicola TaxID=798071 RepID=A0A8K0RGB3_9PLEO|nr:hypothetical protein FB567DRAFT_542956 [Paraphoma chrysanthemicola]
MTNKQTKMKVLAILSALCALIIAVPVAEPNNARAVASSKPSTTVARTSTAPLVGVNLGGSSPPLLGVNLGSSTLLAVNLNSKTTTAKSSSVTATTVKAASTTKLPTITSAPSPSTATYPTALPSSFSAPVQGQGVLSLENLPALPAKIDKTFSGVLGTVYGLMSGTCNAQYLCSITVAGSITNLLVDGNNYTASTSVTAWCDAGRCYGSTNVPATATLPFVITCDQLTGTQACSATISGAARAIFTNGQQVVSWKLRKASERSVDSRRGGRSSSMIIQLEVCHTAKRHNATSRLEHSRISRKKAAY